MDSFTKCDNAETWTQVHLLDMTFQRLEYRFIYHEDMTVQRLPDSNVTSTGQVGTHTLNINCKIVQYSTKVYYKQCNQKQGIIQKINNIPHLSFQVG